MKEMETYLMRRRVIDYPVHVVCSGGGIHV